MSIALARLRPIYAWRAVGAFARASEAWRVRSDVPVEIVAHVQVEPAVAIEVRNAADTLPADVTDAALFTTRQRSRPAIVSKAGLIPTESVT